MRSWKGRGKGIRVVVRGWGLGEGGEGFCSFVGLCVCVCPRFYVCMSPGRGVRLLSVFSVCAGLCSCLCIGVCGRLGSPVCLCAQKGVRDSS